MTNNKPLLNKLHNLKQVECLLKKMRHGEGSSAVLGGGGGTKPPRFHLLKISLTPLQQDFLHTARMITQS